MKIQKPMISNLNYVIGPTGDGLIPSSYPSTKPWNVGLAGGKSRRFRTHAKAIRYADKLARKGKRGRKT